MLFLGRLTAINHSYFEKLSSIVRVDASYVLVCFGPGRAGPGSGLEFRPVATSSLCVCLFVRIVLKRSSNYN